MCEFRRFIVNYAGKKLPQQPFDPYAAEAQSMPLPFRELIVRDGAWSVSCGGICSRAWRAARHQSWANCSRIRLVCCLQFGLVHVDRPLQPCRRWSHCRILISPSPVWNQLKCCGWCSSCSPFCSSGTSIRGNGCASCLADIRRPISRLIRRLVVETPRVTKGSLHLAALGNNFGLPILLLLLSQYLFALCSPFLCIGKYPLPRLQVLSTNR